MALVLLGSLLLLMTSLAMATCPEREAMSDLDTSRILGLWHNVKEPAINYPGWEVIKCTHSVLGEGENGAITSRYMFYNTTSASYHSTGGTLTRPEDSTTGKLDGLFGPQLWAAKYYVLGTDYDNYSVTWLCRPKPNGEEGNIELTVVMSRQRTLSEEKLREANALLPAGNYRDTNQSDCTEHDHEGHEGHAHHHH